MLCVLALTACGQESSAPRQPNVRAAPVRVSAAASLLVQPQQFNLCESKRGAVTATVSWDAPGHAHDGISIYIIDAKGQQKLWLNAASHGQATTGPWVFSGTRIVLTGASGDTLAEAKVDGIACE